MVALLAIVLAALELSGVAALRLPNLVNSTAPSHARLPFTKRVHSDKLKFAAARDRARAKALVKRVTTKTPFNKNAGQPVGVEIANLVTTYIAAVDVGSPPTTC